MPLSREKIGHRALKAGVKASRKRHHVVSKDELLALKVQTMPATTRVLLVILGLVLIAFGWFGWPSESNAVQALEILGGIFSLLFGSFGIRRTLSQVLESMDAIDLAGVVVDLIGEALSNISP